MASEDKTITFAGHNYKADYKYKFKQGQKADGSLQLKEETVMSDEVDGLLEVAFDLLEDWYNKAKIKHIKAVSPYEDGYEPKLTNEPL